HFLKVLVISVHLSWSLAILGCKSEDKTPHLRDPIYLDLKKHFEMSSAEADRTETEIKHLHTEYSKSAVRSIDRITIKNELVKAQETHQKAIQAREYFKIRMKLREAEAKVAYKRAFLENLPWPDPKEYQTYQFYKKLAETSRN